MKFNGQHSVEFIQRHLGIPEQELLCGGGVFAQPGKPIHFFWGKPEFSRTPKGVYPALYVNDFGLSSDLPYAHFPNYRIIQRDELELSLSEQLHLQLDWSEPDRIDFEKIFEKIRDDFKSGLQKIVPAVFAHSEHEVPLEHLLRSAIAHQEDKWLYGFWFKQQGFLGVTPELLFQRDGLQISSMALAGTSKLDETLSDAKNIREHQLVVDEIQRRLSLLGDVTVSQRSEWSVGSIKHLRANIECALEKPIESVELVDLLHPTPALGSLPLSEDRSLQRCYDSEDRMNFGAPFGFVADGEFETFIVSIRCVDWIGNKLRLGSGCGVIAESVLENEWQELQSKRQSVREIFNL